MKLCKRRITTSALERRRLTVEFKRLVTDAERADWNARGGEEAILHSEIAGVVNWCLALSRDEVTQRLTCQPRRVAQANREALRNGNPIADWLLENVIPQPGASTQVGDHRPIYENGRTRYEYADVRLYPNYLQWCQRTKREALALRRFSSLAVDMARSLGVDVLKSRGRTGVCLKGLCLRGEDEAPHDWLGRVGSDAGSVGSVQDSSEKTPSNPLIVQEVKEVQDNSDFYLHKGGDSPSESLPAEPPPAEPRVVTVYVPDMPKPEPRVVTVQVLDRPPAEPRVAHITVLERPPEEPRVVTVQVLEPPAPVDSAPPPPDTRDTPRANPQPPAKPLSPLDGDITRYLANVAGTATEDEVHRQTSHGQQGRTLPLVRVALHKLVAAGVVDKVNGQFRLAGRVTP